MTERTAIEVDVIIPVHNASSTVKEAALSALHQEIPSSPSPLLQSFLQKYSISIIVCCYDDGSKDDSLQILRQIESSRPNTETTTKDVASKPMQGMIPSRLLVGSGNTDLGRGAGYARNRAIELNNTPLRGSDPNGKSDCVEDENKLKFLCLLDSDDVMHKHRIVEQVLFMMYKVDDDARGRTILGSTFDRDPPDSTWHYSNWANNLTDERLMLERYREITILQPTWFMPLAVWSRVGGYIEAPPPGSSDTASDVLSRYVASGLSSSQASCLIHPKYDTLASLKLAEDLRFFHSHLQLNGSLRVHRIPLAVTTGEKALPLVTYRHVENAQSQSFRTSRKLLLQLRALAFQKSVIRINPSWNTDDKRFVIWGCGRDGKDFFKALDQDIQERVYCFVDVDAKKLSAGYYVDTTAHRDATNGKDANGVGKQEKKRKQKNAARKIPIVHYSFLIPDLQEQEAVRSEWISDFTAGKSSTLGNIDKSKNGVADTSSQQKKKKQKLDPTLRPPVELQDRGLDPKVLCRIPVVVCVAMYRTNGVLERNVGRIGRTEGKDLWHFS